jgi:hypothetical protein
MMMFSECSAQESGTIISQSGTTVIQSDTTVAQVDTTLRTPQKATMYSAILPGLGQVYNKKYWKVPIIYGAGGAFVYFTIYWHTKYKKFRDAFLDGYGQPDPPPVLIDGRLYDYDVLPRGRDGYRRWRDLCILGTAAIYFLNIIDAMIDAHFFYYDVSDDLSLRIGPALLDDPVTATAFGFKFNLGF